MKPIRCVVCRTEFDHAELDGARGCPVCGYQGLTMLTNGDVAVNINWFELRLICMWAESLALQVGDSHSLNAFYSVVNELKKQIPDSGKITMFDKAPDLTCDSDYNIDDLVVPDGTIFN
jgi:predicted  nucleic acid-binding Zn-ribbon protein